MVARKLADVAPRPAWRRVRRSAPAQLALGAALLGTLAAAGASASAGAASQPSGGIVFASDRDGDWEIYAVGLDGRGLAQLTRNRVDDLDPVPSANGERIAFRRGVDLWVMRRDGGAARRVARSAREPTWSPDGRRLAFVERSGLVVAAADGRGGRVVVRGWASGWGIRDPAWSPRGDRILFRRSPFSSLETVRLEDGGVRRVAGRAQTWGFAWAPDGRSLAYVASPAGSQNDGGIAEGLFVVDGDGGRPRRLTPARLDVVGFPAWSPDGRRLAFAGASIDGERPGVYVASAAGVGLARVARGEELTVASWTRDSAALVLTRGGPSHADAAADVVLLRPAGGFARTLFAAYPHGGAASPRLLHGPVPRRRAPVRPVVSATAEGGALRARGPVEELAADGARVAVLVGRSAGACSHALVWEPRGRLARVGARQRCGPFEHLRSLAVAGTRVAVTDISHEGRHRVESILTAALGRPRLAVREVVGHEPEPGGSGSYLGGVRGDGDLLAFDDWNVCSDEFRPLQPHPCAAAGVDVWHSVRALSGGSAPCFRSRVACPLVRAGTTEERLVSVDAGRLVLVRRDDALVVDRAGKVLASAMPPDGTAVVSARVHGDDLVLLRTASGGGFVLAVRAADGSPRFVRPLRSAATAGDDALSGTAGGTPTLRLEDLHDGIAVYVHGREVHLLRLSDGRDVTLTPPGRGVVHAELDDAGLFYSYTVAGPWPGRVQFRTWDEVRALLQ